MQSWAWNRNGISGLAACSIGLAPLVGVLPWSAIQACDKKIIATPATHLPSSSSLRPSRVALHCSCAHRRSTVPDVRARGSLADTLRHRHSRLALAFFPASQNPHWTYLARRKWHAKTIDLTVRQSLLYPSWISQSLFVEWKDWAPRRSSSEYCNSPLKCAGIA